MPAPLPIEPEYRIGSGWDSHVFEPARPLWLGGLLIPHPAGLAGHSDGDVLLHAVCDALLGALAHGDIGSHFSSHDPQWKDASSAGFVRHALQLARHAGWSVVNLDANLILEQPRIGPLQTQLRESVAALLEVASERISIKGKTPEGLAAPRTAIAQVTVLLYRSSALTTPLAAPHHTD
ncbi:MAG TPA: 2-C-methyl-D-erythritol 2,4-cyclodiphosphate synthase [Terriglobales bacterium]|nr:2-C-methyl-D-erythritol 2,4-cyclodiphosphate synthase [Terriglobales bacterium]